MAASNLNFAAQVDAWCRKSEARLLTVFRESTQRTVSIAQENLRTVVNVQTGFLRASVRASTERMPTIDSGAYPVPGKSYAYSGDEIVLVIAGAQLGQTIFIGWTAAYSGFIEFGTTRMAPRAYARLAALQWQTTVSSVIAEAKSRTLQ
ncbi:MAG: HK97 gp10 family phage protein [Rhodopseudomonas sp.]|uniref:HK97 gp10 family phage protein n=1 Tax=Rhodopseudomonas sp. TaxID=1078 RepID=UPI0018067045|nr:HK97 gp10 family phage protein [Rhodopseudomonas sp.]NVN88595.1 HK97 gp10 family phage protein [Rhodopseudomonas sp.]